MFEENQNIQSLGFTLRQTDETEPLEPLLNACGLEPLSAPTSQVWESSSYLMACTKAGGIASCVGWARGGDWLVIHSLAVAPPSRGSGLGASILATCIGELLDDEPVEKIFLTTTAAEPFFAEFGFETIDPEQIPVEVKRHPAFEEAPETSVPMVRDYNRTNRGLDHCGFRLLHNTTENATLPPGSVFRFHQSGKVIEAQYRGGPVNRGHIIGAIDGNELQFLWHHHVDTGVLAHGNGRMFVDELDDGRRELRETIHEDDPGSLHLREI